MKIDMLPILNGSQSRLDFDFELPLDENPIFADEGFVFADVTFRKPAEVKGYITSAAGYMELHLTADVFYTTHCARCLSPIDGELRFEIEKPVAGTTGAMALENEDTDDYLLVEDNALLLDDPVCEQILMDFPMRQLCREDCRGLCPKCGKNRNEGDCGCNMHEQDPRLAALAKLLEK